MTTTTLPVRVTAPMGAGQSRPGVPSSCPAPAAPDRDRQRPGKPAPRTDIQALRAVAVALVLVYHLWPRGLTGGFVGVDVFFVVSGFLITAHLLDRPPTTARDFTGFWARRIRRLLPAALLVLAVTLIASRILAPETQWANTARQAGAAALYAENWLLAGDSVDYLAAANAPTPVQHFWSLSVEEQFYLGWPLLIAVLAFVAVRGRWPRTIMVGLLMIVAASLTASIAFTLNSPASAYFITPTRAWEFGLGGLLAAAQTFRASRPPVPGRIRLTGLGRSLLAGLGLGLIAYAAITFDEATPFPGWWALLPTLGAVAVIAAMPSIEVGGFGRLLARRPVQWLGDVSYSVYLWHWPLIVLAPHVVGGKLNLTDKLMIIVVTLVLAAVTKHFVEDRFRHAPPGQSAAPVIAAAVLGMVVVLIMSALQLGEVGLRSNAAERRLSAALATGDPCLGAGSLQHPDRCRDVSFDTFIPAPAQARMDRAALYPDVPGGKDCWADSPSFEVRTCSFGLSDGKRRLALVGNSHAGQWLPALEQIAEREGWSITSYVANRCALVPTEQALTTPEQTKNCRKWGANVSVEIQKGDFDLVVISNRMSAKALGADTAEESEAAYQRGYQALIKDWARADVPTLVIRDTPAPGDAGIRSIPDCVAENPDEVSRCSGPRKNWVPREPLQAAVKKLDPDRIRVADLNDAICGPKTCAAVVGGVLVYFDGSHLTATYARTLTDPLAEQVHKALRKG